VRLEIRKSKKENQGPPSPPFQPSLCLLLLLLLLIFTLLLASEPAQVTSFVSLSCLA
jgi:hypothetical protein